jgi:hypothetical protein
MIEFKPYEAKPITRMAYQIKSTDFVVKSEIAESTYYINREVEFKAYEEPKAGDWVVRLTEEDTYHCTDAVFRERNIVQE